MVRLGLEGSWRRNVCGYRDGHRVREVVRVGRFVVIWGAAEVVMVVGIRRVVWIGKVAEK